MNIKEQLSALAVDIDNMDNVPVKERAASKLRVQGKITILLADVQSANAEDISADVFEGAGVQFRHVALIAGLFAIMEALK